MKTETLTILDCRDFDGLVEKHLGVELQHYIQGEGFVGFCFQQNQNDWPDVDYALDPYGQDSYVMYSWDELDGMTEEDSKMWGLNERYAWKLFELGIFPKEHPVMVKVWW